MIIRKQGCAEEASASSSKDNNYFEKIVPDNDRMGRISIVIHTSEAG